MVTFALSPSAERQWFGGRPLDHVLFMDDDNYLRPEPFLKWLKLLGSHPGRV